MLDVHNTRLPRIQLHPQLTQDPHSRFQSSAPLCCRLAGYHPVVGVSRKLIPLASHLPIKWRQKYIAEQGRDHSSLRSPTQTRKEPPFAVASRLEHCPDQAQYPPVRHSLGHKRQKFLVIHRSEKVL